jgi:hypothetical protein
MFSVNENDDTGRDVVSENLHAERERDIATS